MGKLNQVKDSKIVYTGSLIRQIATLSVKDGVFEKDRGKHFLSYVYRMSNETK